MKCPKCGSKLTMSTSKSKGICYNDKCEDFRRVITINKELEHQQRLDKVLSKLEELNGHISKNIYLTYSEKATMFVVWEIIDKTKSMIFQTHISLETVESLLRDLGEEL